MHRQFCPDRLLPVWPPLVGALLRGPVPFVAKCLILASISAPKAHETAPQMSHASHTKRGKMEHFETIFRGLTRPGAPIDAAQGVCYQ